MMDNKELAWFWINNIPGIGRKSIAGLLDMFGTPEEIYNASDRLIDSIDFLNDKQKEHLKEKNAGEKLNELHTYHEKCIQFIHYDDE